jgi:methylated-DNA-[protein]-cysteine S-methyltransferase
VRSFYHCSFASLELSATDGALAGIRFIDGNGFSAGFSVGSAVGPAEDAAILDLAAMQLDQWFSGTRTDFDLPLAPQGTPFMSAVWNALCEIPYGQTASYSDIAAALGNPQAVRAVGMANHRNPVAIVIPCHRVIGKDGSLTGYAGGLALKERLLAFERSRVSLVSDISIVF